MFKYPVIGVLSVIYFLPQQAKADIYCTQAAAVPTRVSESHSTTIGYCYNSDCAQGGLKLTTAGHKGKGQDTYSRTIAVNKAGSAARSAAARAHRVSKTYTRWTYAVSWFGHCFWGLP